MKTLCQQIHLKLLDPAAPPPTEAERCHAETCEACREAMASAEVGVYLAESARQANARPEAQLPPHLKNRVRAELAKRMAEKQPAGAPMEALEREPRRARIVEIFASPRVGLALAAAALLAVVVGLGFLGAPEPQAIGMLEFASGRATVGGASGEQFCTGLGAWAYAEGATLETGSESLGQFSLGDGIHGALASATKIVMTDARQVTLEEGSAWFDVKPEGKGFEVHSPHGVVRVTGTRFGVSVTPSETRVEVAEGKVIVQNADKEVQVVSRTILRATASGFRPLAARPEGDRVPSWVESMVEKKDLAEGEVMPSLNRKNEP